jgi:hypothetical protein
VQARPGYFAVKRASPVETPERRIDREFLSTAALNEVPAFFEMEPGKMPSGEAAVQVRLRLDMSRLSNEERRERANGTVPVVRS